jgi:two-component system cell cycle response regulator CtrA
MMHPDEKIAKRQDLARRPPAHSHSVITIGKLTIDLDAKSVTLDSSRVHVTGCEYQMLELLALRKGRCVTRGAFMDYLYGGKNAPKPKILDIFICKLRSKLSAAGGFAKCIETVWGRGYLLNDGVSAGAAPVWHPKSVVELRRRAIPEEQTRAGTAQEIA